MRIKPVGNKLLIKRSHYDYEDTYETSSGILVKQFDESRYKGRLAIGEIISMGDYFNDKKGKLIKMKSVFKVGDKVLYYYPSQKVVKLNEEEICFIRAEDVDIIIDSNKEVSLGR